MEDPPVGRPEQVHPGRPGQRGQQRQLPQRQRARRQAQQIVEGQDAERRPPARTGRGAPRRWPARRRGPGGWAGRRCGTGPPACPAGSRAPRRGSGAGPGVSVSTRALASRGRPRAIRSASRNEVSNRRLWPTSTAPPMNSSRVGSTSSMRRGGDHQRLGDPGQGDDERRQPAAGIDQGLEGAEALAAPELRRRHLDDPALTGHRAGGLEVEHHERHVGQRRVERVERPGTAPGRPSTSPTARRTRLRGVGLGGQRSKADGHGAPPSAVG